MDIFVAFAMGAALAFGVAWVLWHPASPANKDKDYKPKGGGRGQK